MNTALAARVLDHGSAGTVLTPGDPGYEAVRSTYVSVGQPAAVVRAASTRDVAAALHFARECGLPLAVRSGGHGIDGRSTNVGGLVLDLGALNHIEIVDDATRRVRIGSGATWSQVADALAPRGWAITSGNHGGVGVGVGGLATRGGSGFLVRAHGLTIDHVRRVELVLPDGQVLHADHDEHPDPVLGRTRRRRERRRRHLRGARGRPGRHRRPRRGALQRFRPRVARPWLVVEVVSSSGVMRRSGAWGSARVGRGGRAVCGGRCG